MAANENRNFTVLHQRIIANNDLSEEILTDCNINELDCYGIPVLHYAIHMQNKKAIEWLFEHGADPLLRNRNGFNAYQESVCTRNEEIIQMCYDKTCQVYEKIYDERVIDGAETLGILHDFQFVLHWELQTWVPLGSFLLPSDNNLARKRGNNLRLDMNIIGFDNYSMKKGNGSLIFYGEDKGKFKKGEVIFINHDEQTITKLCGCGTRRKLKTEEVLTTNVTTMKTKVIFDCKRSTTLFGHNKSETINGIKCGVYDLTPFYAELVTREPPKNVQKPKHFKMVMYNEEYIKSHITQNILLRKNEKEVFRKKTCEAEMWIGAGSIELSEFQILMKFLSRNFDDFDSFEQYFEKHHLTDESGFPIQFKIPLAFSLSAVINIKDYLAVTPPEDIFEVPEGYRILETPTN